jgi:hypothetical protein
VSITTYVHGLAEPRITTKGVNLLETREDQYDYDVTRRTASRKNVGWNGFSRMRTPASFKNENASRLAVSPVMKMKRWPSAGSSWTAAF